jgi:hypothetical protein
MSILKYWEAEAAGLEVLEGGLETTTEVGLGLDAVVEH